MNGYQVAEAENGEDGLRLAVQTRPDLTICDIVMPGQDAVRQFGRERFRQSGLGLGLAICRRLVELHGGALRLASRPGSGTTAVVCLPLATPPAPPPI